jgi:hypothetical protein
VRLTVALCYEEKIGDKISRSGKGKRKKGHNILGIELTFFTVPEIERAACATIISNV